MSAEPRQIRVRFAPSPTGFLHIGGVRTALFSFLYAQQQQGVFLLRIEDTDIERSKPEFEEEILSSMKWLGLNWDEPLVRQSERFDIYRHAAEELVSKGLAYEEEENGRIAIRFKMPQEKVYFKDLIRGNMEYDSSEFDDLVIIKSDGSPTYHLSCVMDDHEAGVTHVIRGEDHLSNTPRQVLLMKALGFQVPKYAHLPLIFGEDGTPLSKRHGAVSSSHYQREGYLPEAVLNYLALLGWGPQGNQEVLSLEQLVKQFSLKRVTKGAAKFDAQKFEWINAQHIKKLPEKEYLKRVLEACELNSDFNELALLYQTRLRTLKDLKNQAWYFFKEIETYNSEFMKPYLSDNDLKEHLESWCQGCADLQDFENHAVSDAFTRHFAEGCGMKPAYFIHPLRLAVTGEKVSPGVFEVMALLGKEKCLERVRQFVSILS